MLFVQVILPLKLSWKPYYRIELEPTRSKEELIGQWVKLNFAGKSYFAIISNLAEKPDIEIDKVKAVEEILWSRIPITTEELKFWEFIADYYMSSIGEVFKLAYPSYARDKELSDKQLGNIQASYNKALNKKTQAEEIVLSPSQEKVFQEIKSSFQKNCIAYLYGLTGSGKTEIYCLLAQEYIAQGKSVLYLIPEIALGSWLEKRLEKFFPKHLLLHHSDISPRKKLANRHIISHLSKEKQEAYILLGTRSSLFLPHKNLGLIIIDEEQDNSYKNENGQPRYNARDLAVVYAQQNKVNLLMGSATPSLESLYNCKNGKYALSVLTERYYKSVGCDIFLIDSIAEKRKNAMLGNISKKLLYHIKETLEKGEQVIILRARRSFATSLQCKECGKLVKCPRCNVNLSLHHDKDGKEYMLCHYCAYKKSYIPRCQDCQGELEAYSAGIQKIEEELRNLLPEYNIARLDSDNAHKNGYFKEVIGDFSKGKIQILLGTQIISKGFDFSNVGLVAIVQADSLLAIDDFRADEKAIQIIEQFKGRSGRRDRKGKLVIQSKQSEHYVFQKILEQKPNIENTDLLWERKQFDYPPYTRLINIIFKDKNQARLNKMSYLLAKVLEEVFAKKSLKIVGPYAPNIDKIANYYYKHIRLCLRRDGNLQKYKVQIAHAIQDFEKQYNYIGGIIIDVDPV